MKLTADKIKVATDTGLENTLDRLIPSIYDGEIGKWQEESLKQTAREWAERNGEELLTELANHNWTIQGETVTKWQTYRNSQFPLATIQLVRDGGMLYQRDTGHGEHPSIYFKDHSFYITKPSDFDRIPPSYAKETREPTDWGATNETLKQMNNPSTY